MSVYVASGTQMDIVLYYDINFEAKIFLLGAVKAYFSYKKVLKYRATVIGIMIITSFISLITFKR